MEKKLTYIKKIIQLKILNANTFTLSYIIYYCVFDLEASTAVVSIAVALNVIFNVIFVRYLIRINRAIYIRNMFWV